MNSSTTDKILSFEPFMVVQLANQSDLIVPSRLTQPTQQVDARDLGDFTLRCLTESIFGTYNVCGGRDAQSLGDLFHVCQSLGSTTIHPVSLEALARADILPGRDLPLVTPDDGSFDGHMQVDASSAIAHGLRFRPWEDTVHDTLAWIQAKGFKPGNPPYLSKEREAEFLQRL